MSCRGAWAGGCPTRLDCWAPGSDHFIMLTATRRTQGTLPGQLASLTALEQVELQDNRFSGRLPSWAGALADGEIVRLDDNAFVGPIPAAWCAANGTAPTYSMVLAGNAGG